MTTRVCNICGGTTFVAGPGKRLSDTGQFPRCATCQSLERHRTLREMYTRMKTSLPLQNYETLQISEDQSLPASWVKSMTVSVYGGENSIDIQEIPLSDEHYDLVVCNHVLEHVKNDGRALQELTRIVRRDGFLQIGVPDPLRHAVTNDWGYPKREDHGHFRIYGMDILDLARTSLKERYLLLVRLADPVTLMEDVYFLFTQSKETADQLMRAFPGASQQLLNGDGQPYPIGPRTTPLPAFERIALDSGKFRSSRAYRDYVVAKGHSEVQGWVTDGALAALSALAAFQDELGIGGPACEIGVHHGRLFIALASVTAPEASCLAIDVFEDQEANVDKSGHGDYAKFMANVEHWLGDASRVKVLKGDSLKLSPADITKALEGRRVRLFSVDGGHTVKHVLNDLSLAESVLAPGGVVIVDDFYNPHWPGVVEGVFRYLQADRPGALLPFAYGDNKLYLAQASHLDIFRTFVERGMRPLAIDYKAVELMGRPVSCLRMPTVADLSARLEPVFGAERSETPAKRLGDVEVEQFIGAWHAKEKTGRWTSGDRGGVVIKMPTVLGAGRRISGRLAAVATPGHPETGLDLYVNGVKLAQASYRKGGPPVDLVADLAAFETARELKVEFTTDYAVRPVDVGLTNDSRTLGVFVMELQLS